MSYGFTQQILPDEDTGRSRGIYKRCCCLFFFSSRRRHTRYWRDWSSDVCSSDLIAETQEMLDFCYEHNIVSECEIITPDRVNEAMERLERNDVRYRFVIDMATL